MNVIRPMLEATWDHASFFGARHASSAPTLVRAASCASELLQRPRMTIYRTEGATRLVFSGNDAAFFRTLCGFFDCEPCSPTPGALRGLGSRRDVLEHARDADVLAVELPIYAARSAAIDGWLVLPRWVALDVPLGLDEAALWDPKKRARVARLAQSDLRCEVVPGDSAVATFYHQMYVPTARVRHGPDAYVRRERFVARAASAGSMLFVRRGDQRLAGMLLVDRLGDANALVVDAWLTGVRDGDYQLASAEVREALYAFAIRWARDVRGATQLGLTSSAPFLGDGILRYKKRWGARATLPAAASTVIALRVLQATRGVLDGVQRAFPVHLRLGTVTRLAATTLVTSFEGRGAPSSIVGRYLTPGIDDVAVLVDDEASLPSRMDARARACAC